ncbi:MAG: hypothetical protein Q8Q31_01415 [Nanoarchaeota archaeon]|nr:hypothetical protein [Nanoarchaeota archaeon]
MVEGGYYGIGNILSQWESIGAFDYLLPFLLIFALVFAILNKTNVLGEGNRAINVIISLAIGLLALQGGFVQRFFKPLFPRFAMGLAVLLVLLILVALFINLDEQKYWNYGFGGIAAIAGIIAVSNAFKDYGYYSLGYWGDNAGWIIGGILIVGVIIAVSVAGGKKK